MVERVTTALEVVGLLCVLAGAWLLASAGGLLMALGLELLLVSWMVVGRRSQ